MKNSILVSLLILAAAGVVAWRLQLTRVEVERGHRKLLARVADLGGATPDGAVAGHEEAKASQRESEHRAEEARRVAKRMIELERKADRLGTTDGVALDGSQRLEELEMTEQLLGMDARQLRIVIEEIREAGDLDERVRVMLLVSTLATIGQEHPETALALVKDFPGRGGGGAHPAADLVCFGIVPLASKDPMGAVAWIRETLDEQPDLIDDSVKGALVSVVGTQDPILALDLIDEFGFERRQASSFLVGAEVTDGRGYELLAALRDRGETVLMEDVLRATGRALAGGSFEAGREWMEGAELSDDELAELVVGVSNTGVGEETGRWIEWMGGTRGADGQVPVERLMANWTNEDYRAAGEWLAGREAGPMRDAAVVGYASAVAPYDPQAAAQWVETLPPGGARRRVAQQVCDRWWAKDKEAAEAFAESEGLR